MSLAPCLTNVDTTSQPLWGSGGGGGGGGGSVQNIPDLTTSSIKGDPSFYGSAFYTQNPTATNDGMTFVSNNGNFGAPLASTCGVRYDIAGQVAYLLVNPTAGIGPSAGMGLLANGITLGSTAGVEVRGPAGNGAGSLGVSSIAVSSINGGVPAATSLFAALFAANPSLSTIVY